VRVLDQADDRAQGVEPGHHAGIERDDAPHALGLAEGVGQLAETGGGRRVGEKIEGMEETHVLGLALGIDCRDHDPADHRSGIDPDHDQDRRAHGAQHDEGDTLD
jgi:hypothetical protein